MSRRSAAPELTVIWWRDIPAQVVARHGRDIERLELTPRFQQAIDAVAMREDLAGTDAYLDQWDRRARPCGADLADEVAAEAARLEAEYDPARLTSIRQGSTQ